MFQNLFYAAFQHFKTIYGKNANTMAITYIALTECCVLLVLGMFFAIFLSKMHVNLPSSTDLWLIFFAACLFIFIKDWVQYSGKKRKILNTKSKHTKQNSYSLFALILLPIGSLILAAILYQAM